jgi:hypothetical protein
MNRVEEKLDRVVRNCKKFYNADSPGHFLLDCHVPFKAPAAKPLYEYDLNIDLESYLDEQLDIAREKWSVKEEIMDDTIPSICPRFGIAEHSAWLGQPVKLQEDTCLAEPVLRSPEDLQKLVVTEESEWFGYMERGYRHLHNRKDGTFLLSVRGTMMPMDIANALRGNAFFTDVVLEKVFLHDFSKFLVKAIQWYYRYLLAWSDTVEGGHVFWMPESWMPANTLAHVSNDAAMLCSPEVYGEFGFPYEQNLVKHYDYVMYHIHNEKMHFVPQLSELKPLSLLQVSHDPKTVVPIEDLDHVMSLTPGVNLMLDAGSDQLRAHIEMLKSRNVFFKIWCKDEKDATDIAEFVRFHSK